MFFDKDKVKLMPQCCFLGEGGQPGNSQHGKTVCIFHTIKTDILSVNVGNKMCTVCVFDIFRLAEIRERTRQVTEEIRQLEQDSEDAQGNKLPWEKH